MLVCVAVVPGRAYAQLGSVPNTFAPGTVLSSASMNANFAYVVAAALNRNGGAMLGTLTTLDVLPTVDNTSDLGSASFSYNDGWFDGTLTVATLSVTALTCTGCISNSQVNDAAGIVITKLATFTSAELATQLTNETGSGLAVFATSPVFTTPNLGTPSAVTLTNGTGLPWAGVSKSGSSLADLATRAIANLSDGSNVALLDTAQTFTATKKVDTSSMTNAIVIGQHGSASAYGVLSFNDATTWSGMLGLVGKGSGDNTLYAYVPTGGSFNIGVNDNQVWKASATGVYYNGSLTDSYGTPSVTSGASSVTGRDYAMVVVGATHAANAVIAFGNTWTNAPICTATVSTSGNIYPARASTTTTALTLNFTSAPAGGDIYVLCRGY